MCGDQFLSPCVFENNFILLWSFLAGRKFQGGNWLPSVWKAAPSGLAWPFLMCAVNFCWQVPWDFFSLACPGLLFSFVLGWDSRLPPRRLPPPSFSGVPPVMLLIFRRSYSPLFSLGICFVVATLSLFPSCSQVVSPGPLSACVQQSLARA